LKSIEVHKELTDEWEARGVKKLYTKKSAISRIENHSEDIRLSTLTNYASAIGKKRQVQIL
jgi:hypothetical protein